MVMSEIAATANELDPTTCQSLPRYAKLGMKVEWMEGSVRVIFGPKPAFRYDETKLLPTDVPEMTVLRSLMKSVLHYNGGRVMFCC
ncbi:hypothetical protein L1987_57474 [Smallanthus sonchifolius]|uniref:Uncharacterized protein n=1 Tax=Smallanthus sonchifolius TaxID=185202 RepID=A0ACB9DCQ4_9ASTR|nr:hypothetical protein L1987_57474 [Smallanthus sonchifolius]